MNAYFDAMRRYGSFAGRSSRAQYWLFYLIYVAILIVAALLDEVLKTEKLDGGIGIIVALIHTGHIVPQIALLVRRLHDTDHSGWWSWLGLTGIGAIVLLVFACLRGTVGPNRFGPSPYGEQATAAYGLGAPVGQLAMAAAQAPRDVLDELQRLAELRKAGTISDAEFEALKAKAMNGRS